MAELIKPIKLYVDAPTANLVVGDRVLVRGWALDYAGIKEVRVSINNSASYTKAITGQPREDVYKTYPEYGEHNAGFTLDLEVFNMYDTFTVNIQAIGGSGQRVFHNVVVKRNNDLMTGVLDGPAENSFVLKNQKVRGWVLSKKGIDSVGVYLDNVFKGNATLGESRPDVANVYPVFKDSNSGFNYDLSTVGLSVGEHTLKLIFTDKSVPARTYHFERKIKKPNLSKFVNVETPASDGKVEGITLVQGYYMTTNVPPTITVQLNNLPPIQAEVGISRQDIFELYPEYENLNVGWSATIDANSLPAGNHMINVVVYGVDETVTRESIPVRVTTTTWKDTAKPGDVISRKKILDEIKENLINVITDYSYLGINNEPKMIADVQSLFTGQVIPARKDWNILVYVLKELATIKERGQEYKNFIKDVQDSLGLSDLLKIREFINYIQQLAPDESESVVVLENPRIYKMTSIDLTSPDQYKKSIVLNWTNEELVNTNANVKITESPMEDVQQYQVEFDAGSFHKQQIILPKDISKNIVVPLKWQNWYDELSVTKAALRVQTTVIDRRGNPSLLTNVSKSYPVSIAIPLGIKEYVVEYSINNAPWIELARTKNKTYTHMIPEVTGPTAYRVKAIDKNPLVDIGYVQSRTVYLEFLPPIPAAPNPRGIGNYTDVVVKWPAVAYAEYYIVYNGFNENYVKNNLNNIQWFKTTNLTATLTRMNENTWHDVTVRAVNRAGSRQTTIRVKTKQKTPIAAEFWANGAVVWRGPYRIRFPWGYGSWNGAGWRHDTNELLQGEWVEGPPNSYAWRQSGAYQAYQGQAWGNNLSCAVFDTNRIRNVVGGRRIHSVEITLWRAGSEHGWPKGQPMLLCSHNKSNGSKSGPAPFMYNLTNSGISVVRGQEVTVNNGNTINLLNRILDKSSAGIGLYKEYHGSKVQQDKAYLRFQPKMRIIVRYFTD